MLHVLPHPGGGGETYVGLLERLSSCSHERTYLSRHVRAGAAAPSLVTGLARAALAARRADVVHVHGDTSTLLTMPLLRGRPWVWTAQGLHLLRRSRGMRRAVVARGLRRAILTSSATTCSASAERDELAALVPGRAEASRIQRVVTGTPSPPVTDARTRIRAELGLAETTTACIFAGSLEPRKAPVLTARAALEAHRGGAEVALLVAGDGPLRGELEGMAGDVVRPLGFRDDVDRLMSAADVFVLPSSREGVPLALLEAMSHGLVPVVADEPGSVEAIGDAGVTVRAGDVAALAMALSELARDPAERARLSSAARERHRREFGLERFLDEMDALYRRALLL